MSPEQFRAGDVLSVSCPFTPAVVARTAANYAFISWPWWTKDPDLDWLDWNGQMALSQVPGSDDWTHEVFRTDPAADTLRAGDTCLVGIPPTTVHVLRVRHYDPPQETGWLPRPRRSLWVMHQGLPFDPVFDDQGRTLDPDDDIPTDITLIFRPFAFLETGDEVTDARGRTWRFDGPWHWHPHGRGSADAPVWPLTLLHHSRSDAAGAVAAVAAATREDSHESELARWSEFAGVAPPRCGPRVRRGAWLRRKATPHHECGDPGRDG